MINEKNISNQASVDIFKGVILQVIQSIQKVLNIFEPIIFPITISVCPFLAAMTHVTNSGRDVHTAMIVSPITISDIPANLASITAFSTRTFPPIKRKISPIIVKNSDFLIEYCSICVASSFFPPRLIATT